MESVWIEPYPDEVLGVEDGPAAPEARYERREGMELAFIAALQHLPANQRAVLILREVLGFAAQEVADSLDTSVPSVNSALQRARKTVEERVPEQSQQVTLRALGDDELRRTVESYMDAMQNNDVDRVMAMLATDSAWSMPPASTWYGGEQMLDFLQVGPLSGDWHWHHLPAHANGQPAVGAYAWDPAREEYRPFALNVLAFEGSRIKEITSFIVRTADLPDRDAFGRWPEHPELPEMVEANFTRFGLPDRIAGSPTDR